MQAIEGGLELTLITRLGAALLVTSGRTAFTVGMKIEVQTPPSAVQE